MESQPIAPVKIQVVFQGGGASSPDACDQGKICGIDPAKITYYVGRETIIPSDEIVGMAVWRETLFAFLQHNAKGSATFFGVPARQVVEFGTEIEI
jgi:KUP system potassium uptake protein